MNAVFILVGAMLTLLNVRVLYRDKLIRGVHPAPTLFFTAWGAWNCFYYPSLGQWLSLSAEAVLVSSQVAWLAMLYKYREKAIG